MNNETAIAPDADGQVSLKDNLQHLIDQGNETVDIIKDRVEEITQQVKARGAITYVRIANYVRDNPRKSVAMAFGAGYLAMRVRTSSVIQVALIAGLGYLGMQTTRQHGRNDSGVRITRA